MQYVDGYSNDVCNADIRICSDRQSYGDIENEQGREEEGEVKRRKVDWRARRVNPPHPLGLATRKDAFNQRETVVICIRESLASPDRLLDLQGPLYHENMSIEGVHAKPSPLLWLSKPPFYRCGSKHQPTFSFGSLCHAEDTLSLQVFHHVVKSFMALRVVSQM